MDKNRLREQLLAERQRLLDQIGHLEDWGLAGRETEAFAELSAYDQHPADQGTETFEREKDIALRDNTWIQLRKVEEALNNLDNGEYGICERCKQPISEARLEAIPYTTLCYDCKEKEEEEFIDDEIRPVEEIVVPPSYAFQESKRREFIGYDGEDAWQEVARYGTANSPQDVSGRLEYDEVYIESDEDIGAADPIDRLVDIRGNGASDLDAFYPDPDHGVPNRQER